MIEQFHSGYTVTGYLRDICTPMFVAELFTIANVLKEPKCPSTDVWRKM